MIEPKNIYVAWVECYRSNTIKLLGEVPEGTSKDLIDYNCWDDKLYVTSLNSYIHGVIENYLEKRKK